MCFLCAFVYLRFLPGLIGNVALVQNLENHRRHCRKTGEAFGRMLWGGQRIKTFEEVPYYI